MDLRRHHISLGALTVAILFALGTGVRAAEPASSSATTSAPCAQPVCADRSCRLTNTGPNNCPVCDCTPCPALNCAPGCRAEEEPLPGGRCPNCVCEVPAPHGRPEMDVPCFTPLLREALRRLAEVEEQLHHLHLLTHENGLRLHRLLPPAEHPHHHHPHPGGAPAGNAPDAPAVPKAAGSADTATAERASASA